MSEWIKKLWVLAMIAFWVMAGMQLAWTLSAYWNARTISGFDACG